MSPATRLGLVVVAILVGGCGSGPGPSASSGPSMSAAAASGVVAASASIAPPSAGSHAVAVDASLLDLLPAEVDGIRLVFDEVTSENVAADPGVGRDASGLAMAIVTAPGASGSTDLAVVTVVRLRDASAGEEWFRSWRDSYDESACASAGGISGHAQATIDGRTVFIGSCAGGAFTYHVRLRDGAIVVSALSVGARRLGEKVIEGLAP